MDKQDKIMFYGKLVLILFIVGFVVKTQSNKIFFANTPRINPSFIAFVKNLPNSLRSVPQIANKKEPNLNTFNLPLSEFNKIAQGVYAKEDKENNIVYIRVEKDVVYEERIVNYQGHQITVRFPKKE
jgi:hypothetical protein